MYEISDVEVKRKIGFQNPWWEEGQVDSYIRRWKPRAYLQLFYKLLADSKVKRAVVLMGPRRVGKTVMIYHAIQKLIDDGVKQENIIYISVDTPNYFGYSLEQLLALAIGTRLKRGAKGLYVFFDEIQYLKDWEIHLKSLVDQYRGIKFVASGSAAAALKLKSHESGAGRFTDFLLPPLTFYEYLMFIEKVNLAEDKKIKPLNKEFINYLNYGGYPEALHSEEIQRDPGRYIRSDIIDKVLLRDLPSLYGISDIQELNRLFVALARNTANEISLDELSKNSGVQKPTIRRYIEYLEAAFLIKRLPRLDKRAKKFKRAVRFKVHLTNPSMYCALFGPVNENSENIGSLVETAYFSQLLHSFFIVDEIYYARWDKGEIDFVMELGEKPVACVEVKWSDSIVNNPNKLKEFISFVKTSNTKHLLVTTRTIFQLSKIEGVRIDFRPASFDCYLHGEIGIGSKSVDDYLDID